MARWSAGWREGPGAESAGAGGSCAAFSHSVPSGSTNPGAGSAGGEGAGQCRVSFRWLCARQGSSSGRWQDHGMQTWHADRCDVRCPECCLANPPLESMYSPKLACHRPFKKTRVPSRASRRCRLARRSTCRGASGRWTRAGGCGHHGKARGRSTMLHQNEEQEIAGQLDTAIDGQHSHAGCAAVAGSTLRTSSGLSSPCH